ncbi:MAG: hypothetical protein ACQEQ4_07940 [Fibrobacterota bacterium]
MRYGIVIFFSLCILVSCTKDTRRTFPETDGDAHIRTDLMEETEDTLQEITIQFRTPEALDRFLEFLEDEMPGYLEKDMSRIQRDSLFITLMPTDSINIIEEDVFYELLPHDTMEAAIQDTAGRDFLPEANIHILSPFSVINDPFRALSQDSVHTFISIDNRKTQVVLTFDAPALGNTNAIELTEEWNSLLSLYPQFGRSVLGIVEGLFDRRESIRITGITPKNHNTIELTLTRPKIQGYSTELIALLPGLTGKYRNRFTRETTSYTIADTTLSPYAASIDVEYNSDFDPVIELSMGRSDGVIIYQDENRSTIQRRVNQAELHEIDRNLVFLSFGNLLTQPIRKTLCSAISPTDMVHQISSEGSLREMIFPDGPAPSHLSPEDPDIPENTIQIIHPAQNPIAATTAAALAFQLRQKGFQAEVSRDSYEEKLHSGEFMIAVGSINESLTELEKSRGFVADYWFQGNTDEVRRIRNFRQKALFSIPLYLALQPGVEMVDTDLTTLHRVPNAQ